jgi:hypothetical protein
LFPRGRLSEEVPLLLGSPSPAYTIQRRVKRRSQGRKKERRESRPMGKKEGAEELPTEQSLCEK